MAFLDTLSDLARQAYPIIQRGVREGLSSRALDEVIRNAFGESIRRQTLLDVMRFERNVEEAGSRLKFLGLDSYPNPDRLPEAVTALRREFSFVVEVRGTRAGLSTVQHVTVTSDSVLSRAQMQDLAIEAVETNGGPSGEGLEVDTAIPIRGVRRGAAGGV